jgi:hypothetical protein
VGAEIRPRLEDLAKAKNIKVTDAARLAIDQFIETHELVARSLTASTARELIDLSGALAANPYQELLANWRLSRASSQVKEISLHNRLELRVDPPETYVLKVLTDLMQSLGTGDEFLVVTNLEFWHSAAIVDGNESRRASGFLAADSAGLFLAAQREAVERGMRLFRVFLLSDAAKRRGCLSQHLQFADDVKRRCGGKAEFVRVNYRAFPDDVELRAAKQRLGHFACIRRINPANHTFPAPIDAGSVIFRPVPGPHGAIDRLEYLFSGSAASDPTVRSHLNQFLQAAELSKSIEELAQ